MFKTEKEKHIRLSPQCNVVFMSTGGEIITAFSKHKEESGAQNQ